MKIKFITIGLTCVFILYGCGGGTDGGQTIIDAGNTIQVVDATSVGPGLKGLEFSDQNGNVVTTYVSDELPDGSVEIVDGVNFGMPDGFEVITNEFVELTYSDLIEDQWQTVRVTPNVAFNAVIVFDSIEKIMKRTPYIELDSNEVEFKVKPINRKITFALINITE